jgi:gliding motility-associated-like protein
MNISTFKVFLVVFTGLMLASTVPSSATGAENDLKTFLEDQTATLVDSTDCSLSYVVENELDFVPVLRCQYFHYNVLTYASPLFADIDGDGQTEIVATLHADPDGFAIIDPLTCEPEHVVNIGVDVKWKDGGPALGDVDRDGYVDIFIEGDTRVQRWEYNPETNEMEMIWMTDFGVAVADRTHFDILDINQDGNPELIPNIGYMIDAITGYVYPGMLPVLHTEGKGLFAFTADADPGQAPEGQGNVELIYGTHLYRYDFINEEWVLVRSQSQVDWGLAANVAIADMDLDGDVDAVITHWSESGEALIWDLQTDELLGGGVWDYPGAWGSRMNISNMDKDPEPEMVMTSRYRIFVVDDIVSTGGFGNISWLDATSDESGHTQITSFDFDGNGTYEAAYRDETKLRIFSGMGTGEENNFYPSEPRVLLDSGDADPCNSYTGMEYPTIGDIDNDGQAEIVSTCWQTVNVYESGSRPWGDATSVWNTQAFNVTNVNQDGTIPTVQTENYTLYNNFLAQVNTNERFDTVIFLTPDAVLSVAAVRGSCDGTMKVEVDICNQGESHIPAGTPISFYWNVPGSSEAAYISTKQLVDPVDVSACITLESDSFIPEGEEVNVFALINDTGQEDMQVTANGTLDISGLEFPMTSYYECDYSNNLASGTGQTASNTTNTYIAQICDGESYTMDGHTYTEPGTYTYTVQTDAGCENIVTLVLDPAPTYEEVMNATICSGETYNFNGVEYDTEGIYEFNYQTAFGCDSTLVFELRVLPEAETSFIAEICTGDAYEFEGQTYTEAGTYEKTLQTAAGCDSSVTFQLLVNEPVIVEFAAQICRGETYEYGGTTYTESGNYESQDIASNGCDSLTLFSLEVLEPTTEELEVSLCSGQTYEWNGTTYTESGTYTETFTSSTGCDSTIALSLQITDQIVTSFDAEVCDGEAFTYNNNSYTQPGMYTHTYTTAAGCDSVVQFQLSVLPGIETTLSKKICEGESLYFGNQAYTTSGTYQQTFQTTAGCDSLVTIELVVIPPVNTVLRETICEGETFMVSGFEYNQAGEYTTTLNAANGCDSTITLQLEVIPSTHIVETKDICEGEIVVIDGQERSTSGIYYEVTKNEYGCDVVTEYHLEVHQAVEIKGEDVVICEGEDIKLEVSGSDHPYSWYPNKGLSCDDCPDPIASPTETTTYLISSLGCLDEEIVKELTVEVNPLPELETNRQVMVSPGQSALLSASSPGQLDNITWTSAKKGVLCEDCPEVTVTPEDEENFYFASVTNDDGCLQQDTVTVTFRYDCVTEEDFFVPNTITPNGDGVNDFFYIEPVADVTMRWLRIYNRWGELVFATTDMTQQWDGKHRGKALNPGVYVYYLEVSCPDNKPFQKFGNVTIIR